MIAVAAASSWYHTAVRDELTGLYTRDYLDEELEREVQRLRRGGQAFSLMVANVDDLRGHNRRQGRVGGDALLVRVAQLVRASVRSGDVVARTAGDEFSVILAGAGAQPAHALAQRLVPAAQERCGAGLSIGVAAAPAFDFAAAELVARADAALCEAKLAGKGRVVLAEWPELRRRAAGAVIASTTP